MHSKNNNKTQTFIQGLRPYTSSIPKTLKSISEKDIIIQTSWTIGQNGK